MAKDTNTVKKPQSKPPRSSSLKESNDKLRRENEALRRERDEAREQLTATSEILRVIAGSPTDLQPVLEVVAETAAKLCEATDASILRVDGDVLRLMASYGSLLAIAGTRPLSRTIPSGRAIIDRETIHIHDLQEQLDEFPPQDRTRGMQGGTRTLLATPLFRERIPIGSIVIRRTEVRPFTDKQIALLKTFADQAVIAIENVRLFQELKEALEQQTATSDILGVIASSPTDIQPVLDVVAENAARICDSTDAQIYRVVGDRLERVAKHGQLPVPDPIAGSMIIDRGWTAGRAVLDRQTVHVQDMAAEPEHEYHPYAHRLGIHTVLATPLMREESPIGAILIRRTEVRPFSEKQIALLKTFADQAVIAIENVRLFKELQDRNRQLTEALEQQTATSDILRVIASSPTDLQPVLDTVIANAVRLAGATRGHIRQLDGDLLRVVAHYNEPPEAIARFKARPLTVKNERARAFLEKAPVQVLDAQAEAGRRPGAFALGIRTLLFVPLLRKGDPLGGIAIWRDVVEPFSDRQIELVKTFADQAVIAIENVRLFKELENRNRQLTEALEQQTATGEVLRVIASSPTELQPVLNTLLENAVKLSGATKGHIRQYDGESLKYVAHYNESSEVVEALHRLPQRPRPESMSTRAMLERRPVQVLDAQTEPHFRAPAAQANARTILVVPLLREQTAIGTIAIWRDIVEPFTERQSELVKTFADQAVIAIENVRLFQELEARTRELARSVEELKALGEVGQAVSSTLDLQTVLSTIVGRAVQLSGTSGGVIYEYDERTEEFHLRASHRMEEEVFEALRATPVRLGQGATGRAARARTPIQVSDIVEERESTATSVRPILTRLGYRSVLAVPLLREERILGALTAWRKEAGSFSPDIVDLLQTFASQSALAIQNARLFREIEAKSRELEAANRHKSEFLANVSHELRTPLNAIIGFSEVLLERMFGELNPKQNEYVDDILSSGRHLLSLINDILDLSKIEAGRMDLEVTTFDLPLAIENALLLIRERATRHGIKLSREIDTRLGDLAGDERKVKQILVNLLSNAVKFTPEGGQIKVDARRGDGSVIVSVSDTGIGIAKEDQDLIFQEFRQASSNYEHKREGTGLGLTLTRKFVEMHGGKIWVDSEPGKGSIFTFTLPFHK